MALTTKQIATRSLLATTYLACFVAIWWWTEPKSPQLPATLKEIISNSGADLVIPPDGLDPDSNIIVGKVNLSYGQSPATPTQQFRMALIILKDDGTIIRDYFEGIDIPDASNAITGTGNYLQKIPKIRASSFKRLPKKDVWRPSEEERYEICEALSVLGLFLPEIVDRDYQLTFKQFEGNSYYLEDVPSGHGFVWFQSNFDINRVTQYPKPIELKPQDGQIVRLDISPGFGVWDAL